MSLPSRSASSVSEGALDNAVGVAVLLAAAERLADTDCNIDLVPFNGEEYYEASGEVEYMKHPGCKQDEISLVINIDSPCHRGSKIAVSSYNFDASARERLDRLMQVQREVVMVQNGMQAIMQPLHSEGFPVWH